MAEKNQCGFRADMIARRGGGYTRIHDVQCGREEGHKYLGGEAEDHEFYAGGEHTFGASREKGRWVTRP